MEKKKETLRLVIADGSTPQAYIDYLNLGFEVKIVDVRSVKSKSDVDLVLFTGGADVNPDYYYEEVGKYTQINPERDKIESNIFHKFIGVPKLGICRGAQFLTVLSGGKLIQHVEGHGVTHKINISQYGSFMIPSTHHQMMFPYKLPEDRYSIRGWSSNFLSTTYLNGKNQEVELPKEFLEPEIVEYLKTKCLCIQGHPEIGEADIKDITLRLIRNFLNKYKKKEEYIDVDSIDDESTSPFNNGSIPKPGLKYTISGAKAEKFSWQDISSRPFNPAREMSYSDGRQVGIRGNISNMEMDSTINTVENPGTPFGSQVFYGTSGGIEPIRQGTIRSSKIPEYENSVKTANEWYDKYLKSVRSIDSVDVSDLKS